MHILDSVLSEEYIGYIISIFLSFWVAIHIRVVLSY